MLALRIVYLSIDRLALQLKVAQTELDLILLVTLTALSAVRSSLIAVDRSPLDNIRDTRTIHSVYSGGRRLD